MKATKYSQVSVQSLLRRVNAADVFRSLGAPENSIVETKDATRTRCFLHSDGESFSLTSEKDTRATYCLDLSCRLSRLNEGGGNYLETYAIVKDISYDESIEEWAERANVNLELRSREEPELQKDIVEFKYLEVARFEVEESTEDDGYRLKPLQVVVDGREAIGRGLIIQESQLPAILERYPTNLYRSQFLYELSDPEAIRQEALRRELYLLGNYYIVFEANTSAAIVHAINQAIELVERLSADYSVPLEAISIYYSSRRIEVEVDYTVFGIVPRPKLDKVFLEMTRLLVGGEAELEKRFSQISLKSYSHDFLTLLAGSKVTLRGRDVYKIRLPYHLFKKTSYQRLNELSQKKPDLAEKEPVDTLSRKARELFEKAVRLVVGEGAQDENEPIATMYAPRVETPDYLTPAGTLAKSLLKRLFSETRQILTTPSDYLDKLLAGGFYPGSLYFVAGFPGTGITSFSLWLLVKIAERHKVPCLYVSLQVGIEELFKRSLASIGRISLAEISKKRMFPSELYTDTEFHRSVFGAYERFQDSTRNVTFVEGTKMSNTEQVRRSVSELKQKAMEQNGTSNVFVVIDSLQLLLAHMRAGGGAINGGYDIQTLTGVLKSIARELDVTIYVTSEFYGEYDVSRTSKDTSNPVLMRLYEDTQFADMVAVLSSPGCSLAPLTSYFESFKGTVREDEAKKTLSELKKIETEFRASDFCRETNACFAVLDVLKNRGGLLGKALFIHHRVYADFEPVDYTGLTFNG